MTIDKLLSAYDQGRLTSTGLGSWAIELIDAGNCDLILGSLPREALKRLHDFVRRYEPGEVICFGGATDPGPERVARVRQWFQDHPHDYGGDIPAT